eukprot:3029935-Rhodomonas_salina.1
MTTRAVTHNDISIQVSRTSPVRVAFRSCDEPICEDSDAEPLGIMVNNENHHASTLFKVMQDDPDINIFQACTALPRPLKSQFCAIEAECQAMSELN